ncbi:GntR family transcriptional regulator [Pseudonocardia nigra]|uniref:GntR family transcriptional regulator n=1 Tax=Pseudonocardia nigra TaxID=1921578 RepID=UPI001C5FBA08|nr:GntR family transcriptional regulator [Pseudonocardia nigra]
MAPRGTYRKIADDLRRQVAAGDLLPGTLVPSELTLVEQYQVSRGTVRSALALLVAEGLIEVVPGQGRRVVGEPCPDGAGPTTAYARIAADLLDRINAGEFSPEVPLPSEAELVAQYEVSRNTVRRAYRQLVEGGAVVVRHGAGAFPAPR